VRDLQFRWQLFSRHAKLPPPCTSHYSLHHFLNVGKYCHDSLLLCMCQSAGLLLLMCQYCGMLLACCCYHSMVACCYCFCCLVAIACYRAAATAAAATFLLHCVVMLLYVFPRLYVCPSLCLTSRSPQQCSFGCCIVLRFAHHIAAYMCSFL